jgi:hypothetical protein
MGVDGSLRLKRPRNAMSKQAVNDTVNNIYLFLSFLFFLLSGNDTISAASAVRTRYTLVDQTGLFVISVPDLLPCLRSRSPPTATTESAGFHSAYQATAAPPPRNHRSSNTARTPTTTYTYCVYLLLVAWEHHKHQPHQYVLPNQVGRPPGHRHRHRRQQNGRL